MEKNKEFYKAILTKDTEKMKILFKNGYSAEDINAYNTVEDNIATELLRTTQISISLLDTLDMLIDNGLNIGYRDDTDNTLLFVYLTELMAWCAYHRMVFNRRKSKKEVSLIGNRSIQTFDKIMKNKADNFTEINSMYGSNIFEYAVVKKILFLFEPHLENMTLEEQELFKGYRLALLFEEQNILFP